MILRISANDSQPVYSATHAEIEKLKKKHTLYVKVDAATAEYMLIVDGEWAVVPR